MFIHHETLISQTAHIQSSVESLDDSRRKEISESHKHLIGRLACVLGILGSGITLGAGESVVASRLAEAAVL